MRTFAIPFLMPLFLAPIASFAADPAPPKPVPYETYGGYFVSNKFEPDRPASFVVLRDQQAFDAVFGAGFVMHDKSHRLARNAFDSRIVIAAIQRGKAMWDFKVQDVSASDGSVALRYTSTSTPQPSATYSCPLILSIPKADYTAVQFIENGKVVQTVPLKSTPQK